MTSSSPLRLLVAGLALVSLPGCQKKPVPAAPPAPSPAPRLVSAEPNSFEAVTRHLDPGGSAYCYFSTNDVIEWVSSYWGALAPQVFSAATSKLDDAGKGKAVGAWEFTLKFLKESGLKDISGFGYSSIALEPGYYQQKWAVHHAADKGGGLIWKMRSSQPNALDFIPCLPANTAVGSSANLKLIALWEALNQQALTSPEVKQSLNTAAQQFHSFTGLELSALLSSLGPNYSMAVTLDENKPVSIPSANPKPLTIPEPAISIWVQLQNDLLPQRLETLLSQNPMAVKSEEDGWTVYKINVPIPLPWLHPTIAWKQGVLSISSSDALFTEMLAVKAGKKPGLAASPEFVKLRAGMPESGSKFGYVAPSFLRTVQAIQKTNFENNPALDAASRQLVQSIACMSPITAVYAVTNDTDEGLVGMIHEKIVGK